MFRVLLTTVLLLATATSQAQSLGSRHIGTPMSRNVLYMTQEVTLSGEMGSSAKVAPLTTSSAGFGIDKNAVKLSGMPVAGLPRVNVGYPTTQVAALNAAQSWMTASMPSFRTQVGAYIKSQGISSAFYSFSQEIMVNTPVGLKKRAIGFNVTIDHSGRPLYGAPKIIDPDPTILEATYIPKRAVEGLPSNWAYPEAGFIKYRLLNKRYEPLTGYTSIDTGGAFDEVPENGDADAQLRCLIDRTSGACSGPTDIRTLSDQTGASMIILDYVRLLEPDYEELPDGTMQARGAISYDARLWDCTSYINRGYFGYVLRMRADRYSVTPSAAGTPYQLIQQFGGLTISPSEPFNKAVSISSLNGQHPDSVVISPHPGDNALWSRTDTNVMKNVVYVAPVRASGGDGVLSGASFAGDMAVRQISASGNTREYLIGTVGDNYWSTGQYDRTVTFNLDNPASLEEFSLIQVEYDDWLMINVNGTTIYIGPYGGDMLQTTYSGSSIEMNCSWSGSSYTCLRSTYATYDKDGKPISPGANCTFVRGSADSYDFYQCPVQYQYCDIDYNSNYGAYQCRNSPCETGQVQWLSGATPSYGCNWPELKKQHRYWPNIDLRPYLRSGQNSIFTRTIVAGGGESWMTVRSRACGASMGLDLGAPPPVPPSGGQGGVYDDIADKSQQMQ